MKRVPYQFTLRRLLLLMLLTAGVGAWIGSQGGPAVVQAVSGVLAILYLGYVVLWLPYFYREWTELNRELRARRTALNDQLRAEKESRQAANVVPPDDGHASG